ncbi:leucine rich repeat-containing protein [Cystoisospora suis]|uniref:Leucine rich repeat-containing protein n=1 Tax=Cystoisospora suis TaxID=483139 RepID=A0A2C6KVX7_9APIC|nr:leucine rich repeat-containing protein [Cystoisospora suis]
MRITDKLLRQRSEHNDGLLDELEEVALHQLEIEKIENLDKLCKHLKILLLQNNIIGKKGRGGRKGKKKEVKKKKDTRCRAAGWLFDVPFLAVWKRGSCRVLFLLSLGSFRFRCFLSFLSNSRSCPWMDVSKMKERKSEKEVFFSLTL